MSLANIWAYLADSFNEIGGLAVSFMPGVLAGRDSNSSKHVSFFTSRNDV